MKRKGLIIIIGILVLGGFGVFQILFNNNSTTVEPIPLFPSAPTEDPQNLPDPTPIIMELGYLGRAEYMDNPHFYDMFMLEPGAPFTWLEIMNDEDHFRRMEQRYQFTGPSDFDFENFNLILVFGREPVEIVCAYTHFYRGYKLTITYGEMYQGNSVFFYQVEKRAYVPAVYANYYLMEGDNKVPIGGYDVLFTFQKRVSEG